MNRLLWTAAGIAAFLGFVTGYSGPAFHLGSHLLGLQLAGAHGIALFYCLRIQGDYAPHSSMRMAWQCIAASCGFAILRHLFEAYASIAHWGPEQVTGILSLRQIPIALTLILLTAGLVAMWSAFTALGLGTRFRRADLVGIAALVVCLPFVFSLRDGMSDAHSAYPFIRHIQSASPVLLAAPAVVALMLHRISQEMGESTLSASLRLLAGSLVIRLIALFLGASDWSREFPLAAGLGDALFWLSAWIFTLGIYHRWTLTVTASDLARQYATHPAEAIAGLTTQASD